MNEKVWHDIFKDWIEAYKAIDKLYTSGVIEEFEDTRILRCKLLNEIIETVKSEADEIEEENTKEKAYKNAFNMLVSELGIDYYDDNDLIKIKYIRDAMVRLLSEVET